MRQRNRFYSVTTSESPLHGASFATVAEARALAKKTARDMLGRGVRGWVAISLHDWLIKPVEVARWNISPSGANGRIRLGPKQDANKAAKAAFLAWREGK